METSTRIDHGIVSAPTALEHDALNEHLTRRPMAEHTSSTGLVEVKRALRQI
jgi:hypothetical protein